MLDLKLCVLCQTPCESIIAKCPHCGSQNFRNTNIEELIKITPGAKIRVYFQRWPNWPDPNIWRECDLGLKDKFEQPKLFRGFLPKMRLYLKEKIGRH